MFNNKHILSIYTVQDLINGAIIQSGSAGASYAVGSIERSLLNAKRLGEYLNCSSTSTVDLINCLRNFDAREIVTQEAKFSVRTFYVLCTSANG